MKAVLISIRPKGCEKILSGEKTIEVRKSVPKCEVPFKAYIYKTKKKKWLDICHVGEVNWISVTADKTRILKGVEKYGGKVIGEFICDRVAELDYVYYWNNGYEIATCLTYREVANYGKGKTLYGLHITDLKIYDKPKELSEFCRNGGCDKCGWFENGKCYKQSEQSTYNNHRIKRLPQSWCYVQELEELEK